MARPWSRYTPARSSQARLVTPYGERGRVADSLRARVVGSVAVHRRRRGPHDPPGPGGERGLEHPLGGHHVVAGVAGEAGAEAAPHTWLGGEVEDGVARREDGPPRLADDVRLHQREGLVPEQTRQVLLLLRAWVVVGEAVDADDAPAVGDQALAEVRADEAGRAGHHGPLPECRSCAVHSRASECALDGAGLAVVGRATGWSRGAGTRHPTRAGSPARRLRRCVPRRRTATRSAWRAKRHGVRDQHGRPSSHERGDAGQDAPLAGGVEAGGRLVEDQHRRVPQEHAGDPEPLALATGQPQPAGAEDGVVALRAAPR